MRFFKVLFLKTYVPSELHGLDFVLISQLDAKRRSSGISLTCRDDLGTIDNRIKVALLLQVFDRSSPAFPDEIGVQLTFFKNGIRLRISSSGIWRPVSITVSCPGRIVTSSRTVFVAALYSWLASTCVFKKFRSRNFFRMADHTSVNLGCAIRLSG